MVAWPAASPEHLQGLVRLAELGRKLSVNLWSYTGSNGGSMAKAVDFLIPYGTNATVWPYPDLDVFHASDFRDKAHAAAKEAGDTKAAAAVPLVPSPPGGDLWYLEPVAWEILSDPPQQK